MRNTDLSDKYVRDLRVKNYSEDTIENYSSQVKLFLSTIKSDVRRITSDELKDYLLKKININSRRHVHSALKLFFKLTLNQYRKWEYISYARREHRAPIILSEEEMQQLLMATKNLKHFSITTTLYATGVRISELLNIRLCDIDRANGVIHIMVGKGNKQRQVVMKPKLLEILSVYYRKYRPKEFLFENDSTHEQYSERSVNEFLKANAIRAGIKKRIYCHLIRHCHYSHAIEHGENLYILQRTAGHNSPAVLANTYIHTGSKVIAKSYSPIDCLPLINQKRLST
jgi:integrase/recombinase XerD